MKVAIFSESPDNEIAIRILVDRILGQQTGAARLLELQTRGWSGVRGSLSAVLTDLHNRREAEALVVVADTDDSPVHQVEHEQPSSLELECRLCYLRDVIRRTQARLKPRAGQGPIKTAVGVAVSAIEAWYLCDIDPRATEAAWIQGLQSKHSPYSRDEFKKVVYKFARPSRAMRTQCASEAATRLVQGLPLLEKNFPIGFGALVRDLKTW